MASNPVASKRQRRRPNPGLRSSLRHCFRSAPTCHRKTCNQNFSGRQKRAQQDDCRNQQYSIVALTNSTSGSVERYAYSAYGEPVFAAGAGVVLTESANENRYTYTGREWDEELGLYHFRARMYDSASGRFGSEDPIGLLKLSGSYKADMLLEMVDPSGNVSIKLGIEHTFGKCVGCGGIEESIDITVAETKEPPQLLGQYAIIQYICTKRSGEYCGSACGENCQPDNTRRFPEMDCCKYELLGYIEITRTGTSLYCIGYNKKGLTPCAKITDDWVFLSTGDGDCHSRGGYGRDARVAVFNIAGWEQIWEMIENYEPMWHDYGDQRVKVGPGPKAEDFHGREKVGETHYRSWGAWDCCPKKSGQKACTNSFRDKFPAPRSE